MTVGRFFWLHLSTKHSEHENQHHHVKRTHVLSHTIVITLHFDTTLVEVLYSTVETQDNTVFLFHCECSMEVMSESKYEICR
jgi:hypothetical protein